MTTSTRYIGNCQICARDQKLHDERMVHHGYKRPGHGSIQGDCPGVNELPYEVSCDLIKSHLAAIRALLANKVQYRAGLQEGKITKISHVTSFRPYKTVEYELGVTEAFAWKRAVERRTWEVDADIRHLTFEINQCTKRIEAWKPLPIRTVEEEQAKADADKAERKAVRDEARRVRAEKRAATKAKQDALEARRQVIREEFATKFNALAASPESLQARKEAAWLLVLELRKTKNRFIWPQQLKCDFALVTLGLAEINERGHCLYKMF